MPLVSFTTVNFYPTRYGNENESIKNWVPSSGIHSSTCVIVVWSFSCRMFTGSSKKFSRYAEAV